MFVLLRAIFIFIPTSIAWKIELHAVLELGSVSSGGEKVALFAMTA